MTHTDFLLFRNLKFCGSVSAITSQQEVSVFEPYQGQLGPFPQQSNLVMSDNKRPNYLRCTDRLPTCIAFTIEMQPIRKDTK